MEALLQDLRFAVRMLFKSPGFAAIAVVCIAIGIGANTSIIVRAVRAGGDRQAVHEVQPKNNVDRAGLSNLDYRDLREQVIAPFSETAAYTQRSITFSGDSDPERVEGASISWNLFQLLGIHPARGRLFRPDEDRAGAPGAVLLSHELWMRRFNGDPGVVGKTVLVNAAPKHGRSPLRALRRNHQRRSSARSVRSSSLPRTSSPGRPSSRSSTTARAPSATSPFSPGCGRG